MSSIRSVAAIAVLCLQLFVMHVERIKVFLKLRDQLNLVLVNPIALDHY